jgi:hypothetical protein
VNDFIKGKVSWECGLITTLDGMILCIREENNFTIRKYAQTVM